MMMRNLRQHMITDPIDRFTRIGSLIESFTKADLLSKWQLKVAENFAQVKAKQLYHCKVLDPKGNPRDFNEYEQRRFHHSQPLELKANCWSIIYSKRDYEIANSLFDNM